MEQYYVIGVSVCPVFTCPNGQGSKFALTFHAVLLSILQPTFELPFSMPPQAAQPADAGESQSGLSVRSGHSDFACLSRH